MLRVTDNVQLLVKCAKCNDIRVRKEGYDTLNVEISGGCVCCGSTDTVVRVSCP